MLVSNSFVEPAFKPKGFGKLIGAPTALIASTNYKYLEYDCWRLCL